MVTSEGAYGYGCIRILTGAEIPAPIRYSGSVVLGEDGLLDSLVTAQILQDRVRVQSRQPAVESILVLAHGAENDEVNRRWLDRMELLSDRIRKLGDFRHIQVDTLREDWQEKRIAAERRIRAFVQHNSRSEGRVIVVPFRIFGFGPYAEVLKGLDYVADGRGLLPHPAVTDWIREQAVSCFKKASWVNPFN